MFYDYKNFSATGSSIVLCLFRWHPLSATAIAMGPESQANNFCSYHIDTVIIKTDDADINLFPSSSDEFKEVNVLEMLAMASNSVTLIILAPIFQAPGIDLKIFFSCFCQEDRCLLEIQTNILWLLGGWGLGVRVDGWVDLCVVSGRRTGRRFRVC